MTEARRLGPTGPRAGTSVKRGAAGSEHRKFKDTRGARSQACQTLAPPRPPGKYPLALRGHSVLSCDSSRRLNRPSEQKETPNTSPADFFVCHGQSIHRLPRLEACVRIAAPPLTGAWPSVISLTRLTPRSPLGGWGARICFTGVVQMKDGLFQDVSVVGVK